MLAESGVRAVESRREPLASGPCTSRHNHLVEPLSHGSSASFSARATELATQFTVKYEMSETMTMTIVANT